MNLVPVSLGPVNVGAAHLCQPPVIGVVRLQASGLLCLLATLAHTRARARCLHAQKKWLPRTECWSAVQPASVCRPTFAFLLLTPAGPPATSSPRAACTKPGRATWVRASRSCWCIWEMSRNVRPHTNASHSVAPGAFGSSPLWRPPFHTSRHPPPVSALGPQGSAPQEMLPRAARGRAAKSSQGESCQKQLGRPTGQCATGLLPKAAREKAAKRSSVGPQGSAPPAPLAASGGTPVV